MFKEISQNTTSFSIPSNPLKVEYNRKKVVKSLIQELLDKFFKLEVILNTPVKSKIGHHNSVIWKIAEDYKVNLLL